MTLGEDRGESAAGPSGIDPPPDGARRAAPAQTTYHRRPRAAADLVGSRRRLLDGDLPPGPDWCRAWSDEVDALLASVAAETVAAHRMAVVALGGYGRRELAPASDVDLMLLHDGSPEELLAAAVRAVVYPLWDAGLTVGHCVRNHREALEMADDVASATAMLDQRTVAGDGTLTQRLDTELRARLRRRAQPFLSALHELDRRRRRRAGEVAERIEVDLKDGAGGLRDLQSLRWAAAAIGDAPGLDPLVTAGYLAASDLPRLARAERLLSSVRVALHLVAGRGDVLRLDLHDVVAARLGSATGGQDTHGMLTDVMLAGRTIDHVHRRAWRLIGSDLKRGRRRRTRPADRLVDGFELVDGVLRLPDGSDLDEPDLPHRLLAVLVDTGAVLDRHGAALLRRRADAGPVEWRWSPSGRRLTLPALWSGRRILPALAELDDAGVLVALLPQWRPLRGRAQRNPYHLYALDRHAWHAVAELGELVRRDDWATEALAEVDDHEGLLLGTMFHDVGKAVGEPHETTGAPLAARLARRAGAPPPTVDLVTRLTRLHLLLPDTARRRDVGDPAVAREVAATVGDPTTLACLHLLAAADGRATGPAAWSRWTADLVATLVERVRSTPPVG